MRCFSEDYTDPVYERLAEIAQKKIMDDPELQPWTFQQGMTFVCDGKPSRFTSIWQAQVERSHSRSSFSRSDTRRDVFQRIHGIDREPVSTKELGVETRWNMSYDNSDAAFIDAKESIRVYYDRCRCEPSIQFRCEMAVKCIDRENGHVQGVALEDGTHLAASLVIVAAGAWSNKLVDVGSRIHPIGHEVAWIKVTPEEEKRWNHMSITTNMSTGINLFPPYRGEIKVLRRSPGFINTTVVTNPEDPFRKLEISHPRTVVDHPNDRIPADAEAAIRENLREIMPPLADRSFDRTKICW
jgi:sarcosine oxidase / L-pipecolate oxidase